MSTAMSITDIIKIATLVASGDRIEQQADAHMKRYLIHQLIIRKQQKYLH